MAEVERDLTAERDAQVIPAVLEIMRSLLAEEEIGSKFGAIGKTQEIVDWWANMANKHVMPVLLARNIRYADINYLFRAAMSVIALLEDRVQGSVERSFDRAVGKAFGVPDVADVTVPMIDAKLREIRPEDLEDEAK